MVARVRDFSVLKGIYHVVFGSNAPLERRQSSRTMEDMSLVVFYFAALPQDDRLFDLEYCVATASAAAVASTMPRLVCLDVHL
jgi:hypothetical protein